MLARFQAEREELRLRLAVTFGRHGILTCPAGRAVRIRMTGNATEQSLEREIGEAVGSDETSNLLQGVIGRDQLAAGRRIDAVDAGKRRGRRRDPDVNLRGTGFADHADDLAGRRAPHDRIVHQHNALTGNQFANRVQFDFDAEVPDRLLRFDERSADVVVPDQTQFERRPRRRG